MKLDSLKSKSLKFIIDDFSENVTDFGGSFYIEGIKCSEIGEQKPIDPKKIFLFSCN